MECRFKECSKDVASVCSLTYIFDVRNWIAPCLEEIHQHTIPHVFLFRRNAEGRAEMLYKLWTKDSWKNAGVILKVHVCTKTTVQYLMHVSWYHWQKKKNSKPIQHLPGGSPSLVSPKMEKIDLPHIVSDSKKFQTSGVLCNEAGQWWNEFLESSLKTSTVRSRSQPQSGY